MELDATRLERMKWAARTGWYQTDHGPYRAEIPLSIADELKPALLRFAAHIENMAALHPHECGDSFEGDIYGPPDWIDWLEAEAQEKSRALRGPTPSPSPEQPETRETPA